MKRTNLFITLGIFSCWMLACTNSNRQQKEAMEKEKDYNELNESQRDSLYNDSVITPKTVDTAGTKLDWRTDTIIKQ